MGEKAKNKPILKTLLMATLGLILLALGVIGAFIPVWPTTPFILAAVSCLACVPKLRAQILKIRFFREYVENYEHKTGLSAGTVSSSLIFLWAMLLIAAVKLQRLWVLFLLAAVGIGVTLHYPELCLLPAGGALD